VKQASLAVLLASVLTLQACTPARTGDTAPPLQPAASAADDSAQPIASAAPAPSPTAAHAPEPAPPPREKPQVQVVAAQQTPVPAPSNPPATSSAVVARLNQQPITREQLIKPLMEGYGLNMLLNIVQLEYAKLVAQKENVQVAPPDIEHERDLTFAKLFKDADKAEYPQLFNQLLQQQHISRAEFEFVLETNAYLRKLAEPKVAAAITEEALQEGFRQLYGETVQVRHIELANMQEVLEAKRRLAAGESFSDVARAMSRNPRTAASGGELPPFSRSADYPQAFKDAAFSLKEGEVSDAVQAGSSFHLIKLEQRVLPKVVKFEDVKESIREELQENAVAQLMQTLRTQFAQEAIKILVVEDPMLKQQYEDKLKQRDQQIQSRNEIREQWERERQRILDRAATQPSATEPALPDIAIPPNAPEAPASEVAQPPATQSGAAAPGAPD
jgi:parvulin-like peptidyl-prolyl isomerase